MQRRDRLRRIAFFLALPGSVALALPPPRPLPDDALVAEGSRKLQAGDAAAALAAFAQAAKVAPRDPRPLYLKGQALVGSDAEGAASAFRAALALDGTLAGVHGELGALLLDKGDLDGAATELRAAQKFDPTLADAAWNLGKLEMKRGNAEAALAAYVAAEKARPDDGEVRIDHAMALRKLGRHTEAVKVASEAASLLESSAPAREALGFCLQSAGKLDEAVQAFTAATRLDDKSASAWWALGNAERARKKPREAVAALDKAMARKPSAAILEDLGLALIDSRQADRAVETARAAAAQHPRSLGYPVALARVLAAADKCPEARKVLGDLPPAAAPVVAATDEINRRCPTAPSRK